MEDFLRYSSSCVTALVRALQGFQGKDTRRIRLFNIRKDRISETMIGGEHFFLRSSVEYSNPQLTVEEAQGIVAARLLEVCGNYFAEYEMHDIDRKDVEELCERLQKPQMGRVVAFLLNTDDVEPDRYSMNPLRASIMKSGQSAFPSAEVRTEKLAIDQRFLRKYEGTLISRWEAELIGRHLETCNDGYMDMVDAVKYDALKRLSEDIGIDLVLPAMRMPLTVLEQESTDEVVHYIIRGSHKDYQSIEQVYRCMGRSMKKKTTLLTVPHSQKGYGSKRAARGRIYFEGARLSRVKVRYRTTPLYPNAIDPEDISVARAEDVFTVDGGQLTNYVFHACPSSPQFILYSLASPEDAVIWHGIGAFGASQLVQSYITTRVACSREGMLPVLGTRYRMLPKIPLQLNLVPQSMWVHPVHDNIDASVGCVENVEDLVRMGIRMEGLSPREYVRA